MLPNTIAVFDDRHVSCEDPRLLCKYALLRVDRTEEGYALSNLDIGTIHAAVEDVAPRRCGRIRIRIWPETRYSDSEIWMTGQVLRICGEEVPVVDMDRRGFIRNLPFRIQREGDTIDFCQDRQSAQRRMWIDSIEVDSPVRPALPPPPPPPPSPPPPPPAQSIPTFAAQWIKKGAITSGERCPISQNPFEESVPAMLLSCFHLFDSESVEKWIAIKRACPVCRASVESGQKV